MHCKQQIEKWTASFSLHAVKFWFVPWLTLLLSSLLVRCSSSHTSRNTDLLPIRICSSSCALGSQHRVGSQVARSHKRAYSDLRGEKKQGGRRPTRISVSRPLGFLPNQRLMRLNWARESSEETRTRLHGSLSSTCLCQIVRSGT